MTPILFDPAAKREHRYPNFSTLLMAPERSGSRGEMLVASSHQRDSTVLHREFDL